MPGRVFISCGQASEAERIVARELATWFIDEGFSPYVATQVQSIPDLNSGLIAELKRSDFYFFINFRREKLPPVRSRILCRGSLYTNQELAIAYALGFEHMLFLNQKRAERGGIFGTIVSNAPEFEDLDEVLPTTQRMVQHAKWNPAFSRQLQAITLRWTKKAITYGDHVAWEGHTATAHRAMILVGKVRNPRTDIGAHDVAMRLKSIVQPDRTILDCIDTSPLKVSGQYMSYSQIIWPESTGEFDLLAFDAEKPSRVFLNSKQDLSPRRPVIVANGKYQLVYELVAVGFPRAEVVVGLTVTGDLEPNAQLIDTPKSRESAEANSG
jgi:hypothetical protein